MFIEMTQDEMMIIDGGAAFQGKYGDLRDVPAAIGQAVKGFGNTVVNDKNFQNALTGTGQITYGIIKRNPVTTYNGWEKIKKAGGY